MALQFTINVDTQSTKEQQPVLASFAETRPESVGDLGGLQHVRFRMYQHSGGRKKILVANDDKVEWQGANFGSHSSKSNLCDYAIGVYDKNTREVSLIPIDSVFEMDQAVLGKRKHLWEDDSKAKHYLPGEMAEKRNKLVEQFGANKAKRRVAAKKANIISTESISGVSTVRSELESSALNNAELLDHSSMVIRNIPPHDLTADSADMAYPLEKIAPMNVLESVSGKDLLRALKEPELLAKWKAENFYPAYVLEKIPVLANCNSEERKMKSKLLTLVACLLHVFNAKLRRLKSKRALSESLSWAPQAVIDYISNTFYTLEVSESGQFMDDRQRDLLVMYILVLCFHIEHFSFSFSSLQKDLAFTPRQMRSYLFELGGVLKGETVTLSAPLNLPEVGKKKSSRR